MKRHFTIATVLAAMWLASFGPAYAQPEPAKRGIVSLAENGAAVSNGRAESADPPVPPEPPVPPVPPVPPEPPVPPVPPESPESPDAGTREYIELGSGSERRNGSWHKSVSRAWESVGSAARGDSGTWSERRSDKKVRYFDMSGHWMGIGLGYSGLVSSLGKLALPSEAEYMSQKAGSINVNINLFNTGIVSTRHFALVTGIGMELNNFKFDKNMTLTRNAMGYIVPDESYAQRGVRLKKSKLSTNYFVVPLLAEFRFPVARRGRPFYFYGGVTGGWCFNAHTKIKYFENGHRKKDKSHNHLNIRNFKYGYTAGIGYNRLGLYASYYPESLFRAGKGPEVRQVNIGLSLNFGRNFY